MKAFTITTNHPEWECLTRECVLRVKSYSGLGIEVVEAKDQWDAHVLKLTVPLRFREPVWFFDSDWWAVQPFELPDIPEGGICAPWCQTGFERYVTTCAKKEEIFGTTVIGMDMRSWKVRHCFRHAYAMQKAFFWDGQPRMDEFFLNIAILQARLPVKFLPGEWVWNAERSPQAIGVHAGGIWPKLDALKQWVGQMPEEKADKSFD